MKTSNGLLHKALNHAILLAGTVVLIVPVVMLFMTSTHPSSTISLDGLQFWPGGAMADNYAAVVNLQAGFTDKITALAMLRNSLVIATGIASLTTALSLCAAYAIVYFRLPLAGALFWLTLGTLLLPLESRFVTTFQVAAGLGLVNTHAGMILPALAVAMGTLFFRQLFLTFPEELLEAAKLDGAGPVRFFVDIILPMSWRRAGAIFVVCFMIGWHQYLWPVLLSTDETHYTVVRGIGLIGIESGPGMALAVLTILPPLVLVVIFQRYFFAALTNQQDGI